MCYRRVAICDGIFTLGWGCGLVLERRFPLREYWTVVDLFCSCDLDLDPMTFIYELDPHCLEIQDMQIYTSYVKASES